MASIPAPAGPTVLGERQRLLHPTGVVLMFRSKASTELKGTETSEQRVSAGAAAPGGGQRVEEAND